MAGGAEKGGLTVALRMTEEEYQAFEARRRSDGKHARIEIIDESAGEPTPPPKRSKYGNRRVEVDGKKFDSQHEADVYAELILRVKAGELKTVLRQVPFDLPGGIRYVADFLTVDADNRVTVYDAKSEATKKNRVYINKKKQVRDCCGLEIVEV